MKRFTIKLTPGAALVLLFAGAGSGALAQERDRFAELAERAAVLAHEVQLLEDQSEIERLQRTYGFYIEEGLWTQAADLFAADATLEVGASGVFAGRGRILDYFRAVGEEYPQYGRLYDRMQLQPVVHVSPDGTTALGRWRLFAQEAQWGEYARWGVGVYENEYVKEDGVWKIRSLHAFNTMYTPYEAGWGEAAIANEDLAPDVEPDGPPSVEYEAYPSAFVVPFHYDNPVSGEPVYAQAPAAHAGEAPGGVEALEATLARVDQRLGLLEDAGEIERLHAIYGYYLARNQWDDLAGIFSREGTIEIAMRGVYVGPESVRRNLNLYGEAGIHHGLLHNHMQYQPVIHVAEDGQTAQMRSRAFSIMGEFGNYSMWMGGIYENDFIKEDGVWKFRKDQVFNTYFVPYALGWKDAPPRPPPGITDANPPDEPPTMPFEMYPSAFLPPFHYPNPVTGNPVTAPGPNPVTSPEPRREQ